METISQSITIDKLLTLIIALTKDSMKEHLQDRSFKFQDPTDNTAPKDSNHRSKSDQLQISDKNQ